MKLRRRTERSSRVGARRAAERGVTLIEALVAMLLLLLLMIGVLPLFTRAMTQNAAGNESTQAANHVRHHLERLHQLSFNNTELDITAGSQRVNNAEYFAGDLAEQGDEEWAAPGTGTGLVLWSGQTTIRQYGIRRPLDDDADNIVDGFDGLADADSDGLFDTPLDASADPAFIHLKELDVVLTHEREEGNPIETPRPYRVRLIKPF